MLGGRSSSAPVRIDAAEAERISAGDDRSPHVDEDRPISTRNQCDAEAGQPPADDAEGKYVHAAAGRDEECILPARGLSWISMSERSTWISRFVCGPEDRHVAECVNDKGVTKLDTGPDGVSN